MPDSRNHLGINGVLKVHLLDKGVDARGVGWFPCVPVASLGHVAEER